jgi:hypothetical protein
MTIDSIDAIQPEPAKAGSERRKRPDLRVAFEQVVAKLAPFFSKSESLNGGNNEYWAARVVGDALPELDHHDVKVLVDAAARYYRDGQPR